MMSSTDMYLQTWLDSFSLMVSGVHLSWYPCHLMLSLTEDISWHWTV